MCLNKFHSISGTTWLRGLSNSYTKIARWNYRDTLSNNQIQALFFFLTINSSATSLYSQAPMQFTSAKICKRLGRSQGLSEFKRDRMSPVQKVYSEICSLLNVPVQSTESNAVSQWKQLETIATRTHSRGILSSTVPTDESRFAAGQDGTGLTSVFQVLSFWWIMVSAPFFSPWLHRSASLQINKQTKKQTNTQMVKQVKRAVVLMLLDGQRMWFSFLILIFPHSVTVYLHVEPHWQGTSMGLWSCCFRWKNAAILLNVPGSQWSSGQALMLGFCMLIGGSVEGLSPFMIHHHSILHAT